MQWIECTDKLMTHHRLFGMLVGSKRLGEDLLGQSIMLLSCIVPPLTVVVDLGVISRNSDCIAMLQVSFRKRNLVSTIVG
jgi:hypothetical protein